VSRAWVAIILTGIGTYSMRASFLVFAHRLADVPLPVQRLLRQIPPAALAAIVVPALAAPDGYIDLWQPRLLAGIVAALIAWRTKSVALTLAIGIGVVMVVDLL
jgi:branched-subunit amino acid transport protein